MHERSIENLQNECGNKLDLLDGCVQIQRKVVCVVLLNARVWEFLPYVARLHPIGTSTFPMKIKHTQIFLSINCGLHKYSTSEIPQKNRRETRKDENKVLFWCL